jgi:AraC-like DNA-binding protein
VREPYPRHWHDELSFCLHTGGGGILDLGRRRHVAPPGCLFVVPPGEVHANESDDAGCSFRSLYLPAARAPRVARIDPVIVDPRVGRAFAALHRVLERGGARLEAEERLAAFVALLTAGDGDEPARRERLAVRRVRERLEASYAENLSLDELARDAGMSPFHLARVFRAEVGIPPHAYQTGVRILRAKAMIRAGHALAAVAAATGFVDQSHFTRHFRRLVKLTPARWAGSGPVTGPQDRTRRPGPHLDTPASCASPSSDSR